LQVSSESDFELFAQKVKEHTNTTIKKIEDEASLYVIKSKEEVVQDIEQYSQEALLRFKQQYKAKEQQGYKDIENEISREWNDFKQERENKLDEELKKRLEEIFPSLATSFIECVSQHYKTGTLVLPKSYMPLIKIEKFSLVQSKDGCIIFKSGNLYIEYSIERIMEELHNDIASSMNFEENLWQV